jgi:hypothetical protein
MCGPVEIWIPEVGGYVRPALPRREAGIQVLQLSPESAASRRWGSVIQQTRCGDRVLSTQEFSAASTRLQRRVG